MNIIWHIAIYAAVWLLVFLPGPPDALIIVWLGFIGCCAGRWVQASCERWCGLWNRRSRRAFACQGFDGITAGPSRLHQLPALGDRGYSPLQDGRVVGRAIAADVKRFCHESKRTRFSVHTAVLQAAKIT
jgi:hypothetical protein